MAIRISISPHANGVPAMPTNEQPSYVNLRNLLAPRFLKLGQLFCIGLVLQIDRYTMIYTDRKTCSDSLYESKNIPPSVKELPLVTSTNLARHISKSGTACLPGITNATTPHEASGCFCDCDITLIFPMILNPPRFLSD